jgi:aldehyde dehydrogenase
MSLDQEQIQTLVQRVIARIDGEKPVSKKSENQNTVFGVGQRGVFTDLNLAVEAAHTAFLQWSALRLDHRKKIVDNLRKRLRECLNWMSEEAVSETGLGRVGDKVKKNLLVIDKTPGPEIITP